MLCIGILQRSLEPGSVVLPDQVQRSPAKTQAQRLADAGIMLRQRGATVDERCDKVLGNLKGVEEEVNMVFKEASPGNLATAIENAAKEVNDHVDRMRGSRKLILDFNVNDFCGAL